MILTTHLLTGAMIAKQVPALPLALLLSFLSHYLLDFLPHPKEYSIKNIKEKKWRQAQLDFLKIGLDLSLGSAILYYLVGFQPIIYLGAVFAILPDGLTLLGLIFNNKFLRYNENFHNKIHFLRKFKIISWLRYALELTILGVAIFFLIY
ncbi:MAG: hypothetical protein ACPLW9_02090 [Minisyncoccales bacterium]